MKHGDSHVDPVQALIDHAEHLNAIDRPGSSPTVNYDFMSGGLVWSDETNQTTPAVVICALRYLVAYRTSLMLNEPREELASFWDRGLSLFPQWVGFRPDRRQPTPELLRIYRRGDTSLRWCLRTLDRELE